MKLEISQSNPRAKNRLAMAQCAATPRASIASFSTIYFEWQGQPLFHICPSGHMTGAIADEQLMLQQQRLRSDGTYATWPEEFYKGDQQVNGENEEVAHGANESVRSFVCEAYHVV